MPKCAGIDAIGMCKQRPGLLVRQGAPAPVGRVIMNQSQRGGSYRLQKVYIETRKVAGYS